jgi:hypothetical protein
MNARQFFDVWPLIVRAAGPCSKHGASTSEHQCEVARLHDEACLLHGPAAGREAVTHLRRLLLPERP